jgi:hypothetical protein
VQTFGCEPLVRWNNLGQEAVPKSDILEQPQIMRLSQNFSFWESSLPGGLHKILRVKFSLKTRKEGPRLGACCVFPASLRSLRGKNRLADGFFMFYARSAANPWG